MANPSQGLTYEVIKDENNPTDWRAEAVDDASRTRQNWRYSRKSNGCAAGRLISRDSRRLVMEIRAMPVASRLARFSASQWVQRARRKLTRCHLQYDSSEVDAVVCRFERLSGLRSQFRAVLTSGWADLFGSPKDFEKPPAC